MLSRFTTTLLIIFVVTQFLQRLTTTFYCHLDGLKSLNGLINSSTSSTFLLGSQPPHNHLTTTLQPPQYHPNTTSQPPHNHLTTTPQPPHNHHTTTSQPPHNHLTTTSQPPHNHPTTTSQPPHNHLTTTLIST